MISQVIVGIRDTIDNSHISYSGTAREWELTRVETKRSVALMICVFFLLVSLGLAILFGYQGSVWLTIAALGPFFASLMAVLCVKAKMTK